MSKRSYSLQPADSRRSERGVLSFSTLLFLLVVGSIIFLAVKLLPPYIDNYQLRDYMDDLSRQAAYNSRMTDEQLRGQVMSEAKDLGITLNVRQIAVTRAGGSVGISAQYDIPVDLLVRQLDLQFAPAAGNRNIMAPR